MDQLSALNAFCRVVEAGSFSAAAAELNVSHTVMSKHVRQLETMLGAQLLNRTTRKLASPKRARLTTATHAASSTTCAKPI
jgi:DNA-binding transcriptional LysR family regulator